MAPLVEKPPRTSWADDRSEDPTYPVRGRALSMPCPDTPGGTVDVLGTSRGGTGTGHLCRVPFDVQGGPRLPPRNISPASESG